MTPLAQAVLMICAVVVTVALVVTLASFRRATSRAETVLQLVEREIRPLASQVEALAAAVREAGRADDRERAGRRGTPRRRPAISAAWAVSTSRSSATGCSRPSSLFTGPGTTEIYSLS